MQKDVGGYSLNISKNNRYCFGLGFEKYPILDLEVDNTATIVASVFRIDLLFFSINFTKYPKMVWRDSNPE